MMFHIILSLIHGYSTVQQISLLPEPSGRCFRLRYAAFVDAPTAAERTAEAQLGSWVPARRRLD